MSRPSPFARGSILLVVLITLLITGIALFAFIEKASDNLLIETREADARRLRVEAYSALETIISVLEEFRQVNGSLKSPSEGWGDPLVWADYPLPEGCRITVEFADESGKISLPHATPTVLVELFKSWELPASDAEKLADSLQDWCVPDYVSSSGFSSTYDQDDLPFASPARFMKSFDELASIDVARSYFYDESGRPNERFQRFVDSVSLLDFKTSNINGARPGVLGAMGLESVSRDQITDYLSGTNFYKGKGPSYFRSLDEAASLLGNNNGAVTLGVDIQALRVIVTVWDRNANFRLNTVLTPAKGGAKAVTAKANPKRKTALSSKKSETATPKASGSSKGESAKQKASLNYPFTILEIRENDEVPKPPQETE